jgi:hypothetical protein
MLLEPGNEMRSNTATVRKAGIITSLFLLILVIVCGFAIIVLPHIDLKGVRQKIASETSSQLKGEVVISRASLSLLPWPHFTLRGVKIASSRWGQGVAQEIRIYLRLLPLFKKKVLTKDIFVKGPILDVTLHEGTMEKGKDIFSYVNQKERRMIPSLKLEGGIVNILRPDEKKSFFTIQGLTGNVVPREEGDVELELSFSSLGAERIEVRITTSEKDEMDTFSSFLVTGTGVNVEKIGNVALEVLGKNETVQKVFGILQGGDLSHIIFHGEGRNFEEALDFERNVRIRGTLADGKILTPPGPLPLEEVSGEFEIEEAVLRCWDADLRLGRSTAREGELVVGLISEREDFHLEGLIDADAEDLVRYLPLVLTKDSLKRDLEDFREAKGRGKGRLVLGENIHQIRPQVEVESFHVSFRQAQSYEVISLDGGQFFLQDGTSAWRANTITWKGYRLMNAEGDVIFRDRGIEITVAQADLCGIQCAGSILSRAGVTTHSFRFWAEEENLSSAILCLWGKDARIEGTFRLDWDMWAEGIEDPLREASKGSLSFISQGGRIYRWTLLSQLFGMLNIIGLFEGKFPDFAQQGFQYDTFIITGELRDGYIYLKEAVIDGPAMKIVGEGKINLVKGEADITVLIAPLKTVDTIIKNIPIVGKIITGKSGTFISVPFSVKGPIDNAKVTLLPPEAVGSGLWGVLKRTLQTPVKTLESAFSQKEDVTLLLPKLN